MKLLSAEIQNFKNISERKVDIHGRSMIVVGKHETGKSSLIQALCSPVNADFRPKKPTKEGEEKGEIELAVGDDAPQYVINYSFDGDKKGTVTVKDSDGNKLKGGSGVVKEIVGNIGFDIFEFIRMGTTSSGKISKEGMRRQIEELKGFLPEDTKQEIAKKEKNRKEKYDERSYINSRIKELEGYINSVELTDEQKKKYAEPIDIEEKEKELENLSQEKEKYEKVERGVSERKEKNEKIDNEISDLEAKIKALKEEKEKNESEIEKGESWLSQKERPSFEKLQEEIRQAREHNKEHEKVKEIVEKGKEVKEKKESSEELTEEINGIRDELRRLVSENLPVEGLTFDEDGIYYEGLPFSEEQHATSRMIKVGVEIACAINPNLRLITISDGSLLDEEMTKEVLRHVQEKDYQVIIEKVDDEHETAEIEFVETKNQDQ